MDKVSIHIQNKKNWNIKISLTFNVLSRLEIVLSRFIHSILNTYGYSRVEPTGSVGVALCIGQRLTDELGFDLFPSDYDSKSEWMKTDFEVLKTRSNTRSPRATTLTTTTTTTTWARGRRGGQRKEAVAMMWGARWDEKRLQRRMDRGCAIGRLWDEDGVNGERLINTQEGF